MKLTFYTPAKNLVLLEAIKAKASKSGNIILKEETFVGYYRVLAVGPLCEQTKPGYYVASTLQLGVELDFEEGQFMQLPEQGIDGYYTPTDEELKNPTPVFKITPKEEEELNVIDSEGGENDLGEEFGLREN